MRGTASIQHDASRMKRSASRITAARITATRSTTTKAVANAVAARIAASAPAPRPVPAAARATPSTAATVAPPAATTAPPKPWHVYMIECRDGSIYTGTAIDVAARYALHCRGKGARYTRSHPPARLIAVIPQVDRSAALRTEYAIKQLPAGAKRKLAARHLPDMQAPRTKP